MFNVRSLKKEVLIVVAKELCEEDDETHRAVNLKKLIENCDTSKNDLDFVKEFIITTVNDRILMEKRDSELVKIERKNAKEVKGNYWSLRKLN